MFELIGSIIFIILLICAGGIGVIGDVFGVWGELYGFLLPFFPSAIEEYLTSPGFITGIVLTILSLFGIYLGYKGRKFILKIASIIVFILGILNFFCVFN